MYKKIDKGSVENIYGFYDCQIPPFGYGCHSVTGEILPTDTLKRHPMKEHQYWERTPLPDNWLKKRKQEAVVQGGNSEYYDKELQSFIEQEWRRRLLGVWVWINGKKIYLTGLHYFYLNWWKIDIGYPQFREPDRKFFYVLQYCVEDPRCGGLVEGTKRRQGKTYRGGCFVTEDLTRNENCEGGIQSKTTTDARDVVFKRAIVYPFKNLPDFFRPIFDASKGITPTSELRFAQTTVKGKRALEQLGQPELNSVIDWASSEVFAYDGRKKRRMFQDEVGKTENVDIYERAQVVRYCMETDGKWTGKALYSTTVEEMKSGGAEFKKLWDDSNPDERDGNEQTKTGLYRYMTPAYETLFDDQYKYCDRYGYPKVEEAKEFFLRRRAGLINDPHTLSGEIRKNPFNEQEMFRVDGELCPFNPELLNDRLDYFSWAKPYIEQGDFIWEAGVRDTKVLWKKNSSGRFHLAWNFQQVEESNYVTKKGNLFYPNNKNKFVIGSDPFSHDKVKDNRRSNAAAFCLKKDDNEGGSYDGAFVCMYVGRPPMKSIYYEDMIMMANYFGCQILFENKNIEWKDYIINRGYEAFLLKLPQYDDYGIPATVENTQKITEYTEEYIETHIQKVYFKSLVEEWIIFDPGNTTKFDRSMAAGYTLYADRKIHTKKKSTEKSSLNKFVRTYKAA